MRRYFLGISALGFATFVAVIGCGDTASDPDAPGSAGKGSSGDAGSSTNAGSTAGGSGSGGSGNTAGKPNAGSAQGGSSNGGDASAGGSVEPGGDAGASHAAGGAGGLTCDARKVLCKLLPAECPPMQVRAVVGTCWGDCVDIEDCPCSSAAECPNSNEYTCWMNAQHCGPYLK